MSIFNHKCQSCRIRMAKAQPLQKLRMQVSTLWTGRPNARRPRSPSPLRTANNPHHHTAIEMMTAMNAAMTSAAGKRLRRTRSKDLSG
jgi:hypothetical protein